MRYFRLDCAKISLLIYLFYLAALTLAPFDFSMTALAERTQAFGNRSNADFVANILGFVPLGAILYFLLARPDRKNTIITWGVAVSIAAILSILIEIGQLFLLSRISSPADLLANTLGAALGFLGAYHLAREPWTIRFRPYQRKLVLLGLTLYLGGLVGIFLWCATGQELKAHWDSSYPVLIGNEATLDRPWLGKIFVVALYDRVLTADEIGAQVRAGPHDAEGFLKSVPVTLYAFRGRSGARVPDLSPVQPPLDLEVAEPSKVIWLPSGGLELMDATVLESNRRPEKIYRRFTETDTFSVAAWLEPKDILQKGPARIVSFSLNPGLRNFTLGQEKSEIHLRVRNRAAGPNGDRLNLRTKGLGLRTEPTHVVAIYDRGTERLYANGLLVQSLPTRDGVTFIMGLFGMDVRATWQRGLSLVLLLGPLAVAWLLARE